METIEDRVSELTDKSLKSIQSLEKGEKVFEKGTEPQKSLGQYQEV